MNKDQNRPGPLYWSTGKSGAQAEPCEPGQNCGRTVALWFPALFLSIRVDQSADILFLPLLALVSTLVAVVTGRQHGIRDEDGVRGGGVTGSALEGNRRRSFTFNQNLKPVGDW